jgi:hypothetical protein
LAWRAAKPPDVPSDSSSTVKVIDSPIALEMGAYPAG